MTGQLRALATGAQPLVNAYLLATPGRADFLFRELSSRLEVHGTATRSRSATSATC